MSGQSIRTGIVPACLSFLAIYNPSLSTSDETAQEQILFYHTKEKRQPKNPKHGAGEEAEQSTDEVNEQLRQIGLAQGIVQFARYVDVLGARSRLAKRNYQSIL